MPNQTSSARERRVTQAVKWAFLDHLEVEEIVERFEHQGIDLTARTVRDYLNEEEAEAVKEQIRGEHADTRLQIADREERLYQRAREAEADAYDDEAIKRVFPQTKTVTSDMMMEDMDELPVRGWRALDESDDEWPEWATPGHDYLITFTDGERYLKPGQRFPIRGIDGEPKYTTEFVGLETVLDEKARAFRRQEQSAHLEAKGEVLGLYEETVNLEADVDHGLDDESEDVVLEAIATLRSGSSDTQEVNE